MAREDVEARGLTALLVGRAELHEHVDRVETRVLGERAGDDLERRGERLDRELGPPADGRRVVLEPERELGLGRTAARNELAVLDDDRDDPDRVLEGAVQLVDHVLGTAAHEDRDRLRVLAARDVGHLLAGELPLLDEARAPEFLGRDRVDRRDERGTRGPGELLHVRLLDPAQGEDAGLREVVLGDVVDPLLAEENGRAGLDDLIDDRADHPLLFVEEGLELVGARDVDLGVDLGLLELDRGVQEEDLRVSDLLRHGWVDSLLVDQHALDDLGVVDRAADLLLDLDVVLVDRAVVLGDHADRLHDELGQLVLGGLGALAGHRGLGDLLEVAEVGLRDRDRDLLEDLLGLLGGEPVPGCDHRGVDVLVEELLGALQELARDHDCRGGAVADLVVLGLGDLDHHLGGRVLDVHLLQDRHAVVRDHDVADRVDEHLVHALRAECGPDCVRDGLGRGDVVALRVPTAGTRGPFPEDEDRLSGKLLRQEYHLMCR